MNKQINEGEFEHINKQTWEFKLVRYGYHEENLSYGMRTGSQLCLGLICSKESCPKLWSGHRNTRLDRFIGLIILYLKTNDVRWNLASLQVKPSLSFAYIFVRVLRLESTADMTYSKLENPIFHICIVIYTTKYAKVKMFW